MFQYQQNTPGDVGIRCFNIATCQSWKFSESDECFSVLSLGCFLLGLGLRLVIRFALGRRLSICCKVSAHSSSLAEPRNEEFGVEFILCAGIEKKIWKVAWSGHGEVWNVMNCDYQMRVIGAGALNK